jgi:hypothetical protein
MKQMAKLAKEQKNYMMALANYQAIQEQYAKEVAKLDDSDIDAYLEQEEAICERLGTQAAYDLLAEAEKQLIEWAFRVIENHPVYKQNIGDLEELRNLWPKRVDIRKKIAELAVKLSA